MSLIDIFYALSIPNGGENILNAFPIPDYPSYRIAKDSECNPVLLLASAGNRDGSSLRNFNLKHIELIHNAECKVAENDRTFLKSFTVIRFKNAESALQEYFLRVSETFIKSLSDAPTQGEIIEALNRFIEVFQALSMPPMKTVQGLWAELFLIDNAADPSVLVKYWHSRPEERFDFSSESEKIEVKSNSSFERAHAFSSEQLSPPIDTSALIASIFTVRSEKGKGIASLMDSLTTKLNGDAELIEKLSKTVCSTLGSALAESLEVKFDDQVAKGSLRFYRCEDIPKISSQCIPSEVREVKYKSDLSNVTDIDVNILANKKKLFSAL